MLGLFWNILWTNSFLCLSFLSLVLSITSLSKEPPGYSFSLICRINCVRSVSLEAIVGFLLLLKLSIIVVLSVDVVCSYLVFTFSSTLVGLSLRHFNYLKWFARSSYLNYSRSLKSTLTAYCLTLFPGLLFKIMSI